MTERRLVIAGTGSNVGKSTLTIGIMSALKKRGLDVQGFKCGPDFIDPSYHTAVTNRVSRNLDSWMLREDTVLDTFIHGSKHADISIIEGVMGFFDGKSSENNSGSTAEISMITKSPVLLVVDCASMARSAAAIVKGFQVFDERVHIAGVIANNVGSPGHFQLVKTAIEQDCEIPVIGYLQRETDIEIPSRHLGLIPTNERKDFDHLLDRLGDLVLETVDIDKLLEISVATSLISDKNVSLFDKKKEVLVRIAVAKDAAFQFYYPENLELLEANGAEIVYFSPLNNDVLPDDVHGLYLGGGYPERFAHTLSTHTKTKDSLKIAIENGLPTLAECGGFLYLTNCFENGEDMYDMVGVIPGKFTMQTKLAGFGYREINGRNNNFLLKNETARGHTFHYFSFKAVEEPVLFACETEGIGGKKEEGFLIHNVVASNTYMHFASCPTIIENWIEKCLETKQTT